MNDALSPREAGSSRENTLWTITLLGPQTLPRQRMREYEHATLWPKITVMVQQWSNRNKPEIPSVTHVEHSTKGIMLDKQDNAVNAEREVKSEKTKILTW